MDITGIIIAGGKNSRMGTHKAFLQVSNEPIINSIKRELQVVTDHILLVTSEPAIFSHLNLPTVADIFPHSGPLGGIHAGLARSRSAINLVVPCDLPFLHRQLFKLLLRYASGYDVVVPRLGVFLEPLVALYNKTCLGIIEEQLRSGRYKVTSFFPRVKVKEVEREEIARLADPEYLFFNVNTPLDLNRAREMAKKNQFLV